MGHLQVKNWDKFQHYKRRNPPWIRLYCDLDYDEDFMELTDAQKWWLVCCWQDASRDKTMTGLISANEKPFKRRWNINSKTSVFEPLIERGFLIRKQDDSDVPADCEQLAIPETETETETEAEAEAEVCPETENGSSPTTDRVLRIIDVIDLKPTHGWTHGEKKWPFLESHIKRLHNTFGKHININDCAEQAFDYFFDAPENMKTYNGMPRYLSGWIKREIRSGGGKRMPPISWEATINAKTSGG